MKVDDIYQRIDIENLKSEERRVEDRKVSEAVFDKESLMSLYTLAKKDAFTEMKSIISTGKEAAVYHGVGEEGEVAIKIYLVENSDFRHMSRYIRGDPRFDAWRNRRQLVYMWAQKEFKNLNRICDTIPCPKPIAVHNNVLVMQFLGKGGKAAPRLRDAAPKDPKKYYAKISQYIRDMYKMRLVHADLSEFNILDYKRKPYIIDISTGVLLDHPQAMEFLERDIGNIINYFQRLGVDADYHTLFKSVLDDDK